MVLRLRQKQQRIVPEFGLRILREDNVAPCDSLVKKFRCIIGQFGLSRCNDILFRLTKELRGVVERIEIGATGKERYEGNGKMVRPQKSFSVRFHESDQGFTGVASRQNGRGF